jgi:hypothetical protein
LWIADLPVRLAWLKSDLYMKVNAKGLPSGSAVE